jgi:methylated-DNA-[protein]-cysteine S-methyltransferase
MSSAPGSRRAPGDAAGREDGATPAPSRGVCLFDTPVGRCALAWTERGIAALQLPERDDATTLERAARRAPGAKPCEPPPAMAAAIARVRRLLEGARDDDLADLPLDTEGIPEFHRRAQAAARRIPPGRTMTYGELAVALGDPGAARAVGQAMGANPYPVIVPCHRVLAAGDAQGGFSAFGGVVTKRRLLEIEGALAPETLPLFGGRPG